MVRRIRSEVSGHSYCIPLDSGPRRICQPPPWLTGSASIKKQGFYLKVWISVDGHPVLRKKRWAFVRPLTTARLSLKLSPRDEIVLFYASTMTEECNCPPSPREPSTPRGPVRHTVRPFIKEFKTRSAKSSAARLRSAGGADNDGSRLSFLDLDVFSLRQNNDGNEHMVAFTAADAVFGRGSPVAPVSETSQIPDAPAGRVLPSLIGEDDPLPLRLTDGDEKFRRRDRIGKVKSPLPIRRNQRTLQPKSNPARVFLERPDATWSADILIASTPLRKRRSIQKRWVLKTELKAGEKWKRRLCKAARRRASTPATGART